MSMSPDQLKALVRRFFEEVWNQQKMDVMDEVFAPTVVLNGQAMKREAIRQVVASRRAAFPDIRVTVEDQVAEGEKVSTRRTWHATHRGSCRGIAPTGTEVSWVQISIVRFAEGKIVEDWPVTDELSLLRQLGHVVS